jgi:hypothetical protein
MGQLKLYLLPFAVLVLVMPLFAQDPTEAWKEELNSQVQLFGHRNWIMIVDAAYPSLGKPAIKTILTGESQLTVVREVLKAVYQAPHISPQVFLDKEMDFVTEADAGGIDSYRNQLMKLLEGQPIEKMLHEDLIAIIDDSANTFNILVLKTNMTIPYTSVFIRLDCGYWNPEQENVLRGRMKKMK